MAKRESKKIQAQESEEKYAVYNGNYFRKLFQHSFSGITLLNNDLNIIYRSPTAKRIGGWDNKVSSYQTIPDIVHPAHYEMVAKLLQTVLKKPGTSKTCTFQSRHFAGHYIWVECRFTNMLLEPEVNAIVCNFHDITQLKEAELRLQQTLNEVAAYKYALDESAIVAVTDQKGTITHVNENFCKISKYDRSELLGADHRIINSGYHDKGYIKNVWKTIASGNVWKGEFKNKAKDGTFYWVDSAIVPFMNEVGKPYQYVSIRSDITERKLNQERVEASERFLTTIANNLPAMISYWTSDQRCLYANKTLLEWFNKTTEEIVGIKKSELLDESEYKNCEPHIRGVLSGQSQIFYRSFYKKGNQTIYTHTQYVPDIQNGTVKGFYSLICDYTDVQLAEMKIAEKNKQIENLLENITDGFIALDTNLCCTYANKHVENIFGRPAAQMLGKNIWELFPKAKGSASWSALSQAVNEQRYICHEDYFAPLDIWHENRIYPSETGVSVFIRNITSRKEEEKHLRLLESVITNTTDAVLITEVSPLDEPGPAIVYVNDAFTRMTGYTVEDVKNKTPRILQGPKTDEQELKRLRAALNEASPCEVTTINYKKGGEEFWINFSVSPVKDENGLNTHFIAIEKDVTHAKNEELQKLKLAQSIAESLKEKNEILESIGDAFFAIDKHWIVTYWNNMAEKIVQTPKESIVDKNLWTVFPEAIGSESYFRYHEAMDSNRNVHFEDYYKPLGRWFEVSAYPSAHGLSVYFKDITERKKSEKQLQQLNDNLQDQNEKLKEISWMQSHIIRAPLARIMGLIPLIQEKYNDDEVMLKYLDQSAGELDSVIRSIVDKSFRANY